MISFLSLPPIPQPPVFGVPFYQPTLHHIPGDAELFAEIDDGCPLGMKCPGLVPLLAFHFREVNELLRGCVFDCPITLF